jgi:hypothetical protein
MGWNTSNWRKLSQRETRCAVFCRDNNGKWESMQATRWQVFRYNCKRILEWQGKCRQQLLGCTVSRWLWEAYNDCWYCYCSFSSFILSTNLLQHLFWVKIREQFITFLMIFDVDIFQDFTAELNDLLPNRLAEWCVGECCFSPFYNLSIFDYAHSLLPVETL